MDRIANKNDTMDKMENANRKASTEIKIAPKAKGELSSGYSKIATPAQPDQAHAQTKAERASVGGRWQVGKQLHGTASPSSEESFLKQKKNHEARGR